MVGGRCLGVLQRLPSFSSFPSAVAVCAFFLHEALGLTCCALGHVLRNRIVDNVEVVKCVFVRYMLYGDVPVYFTVRYVAFFLPSSSCAGALLQLYYIYTYMLVHVFGAGACIVLGHCVMFLSDFLVDNLYLLAVVWLCFVLKSDKYVAFEAHFVTL